jgi:2'-5' RNA ligase
MCFGVQGARWVPKDQMHLTIRFIGEADDADYQAISDGLSDVIANRFEISLKGVGYFPPHRKPNVLWVGLEKSEALTELRKGVEAALETAGIEPEERKFSAHVTLARLSPTAPLPGITNFLSANNLFSAPSIPVEEFHLYSSVLTSSGPIHRREASYRLLP